jgi:hypothetical protein
MRSSGKTRRIIDRPMLGTRTADEEHAELLLDAGVRMRRVLRVVGAEA